MAQPAFEWNSEAHKYEWLCHDGVARADDSSDAGDARGASCNSGASG